MGVLFLLVLLVVFIVLTLAKHVGEKREWTMLLSDPPTLVFRREDLQRIWNWEIESGHYPSSQKSESRRSSRRQLPTFIVSATSS
jgi:DDB1- and CUL4-associated factor 13